VTAAASPREVFGALYQYQGADAYTDVLMPWLDNAGTGLRELLAPLAVYGGWRRDRYVWGDLLEQAYALSRVSDVLLLAFQPPLPDRAEPPWAHALHLNIDWPTVTVDQYLALFTALGMTQIQAREFDPFFHEIVAVQADDDPDAPVTITGTVWPGLMFGELLFSRSGVRVRAGARHAQAGIADQSLLHEVFVRRYRATSDGSLGWGSNSQWKTDFRRDYLTADAYELNVDATDDIDAESGETPGLTAAERRDLLRHRCLIRQPQNPAAMTTGAWKWRLTVPRLPATVFARTATGR
jgi:hypothetical protein